MAIRFLKKILSPINHLIDKEMGSYINKYSLEFMRDRIFIVLSSVLTLCIGPIMFYGAYLFYKEGATGLALLESLLCLMVIIALNSNLLNLRIRKGLITLIFYGMGNVLIVYTGPSGAGMVCVVFSFMLSVSLLSKKYNLIFFSINVIIFTGLTSMLYAGLLDGFAIAGYKQTWFINVICVQLGILTLFFLWDIIYSGLEGQVERFELAIRGSSDGIWDWDFNTSEVYYSPRWKEQLGYREEELTPVYQTFEDLIHPEDKEKTLKEIKRFVEGECQILDMELRMRHKEGTYRWIRSCGAAYRGNDNKAYRMAGSHTDITEKKEAERALKQSEEKYRMIAQNTADVIWVLDITTMRFTYISPSIERVRGYTVEEAMMEDAFATMPPEHAKKIGIQMEESLAHFAENPQTDEIAYNQIQQYSKSGELRWVELSARCRVNEKKRN